MSDEVMNDGQPGDEQNAASSTESVLPAVEHAQQRVAELDAQTAQLKDQLLRKAAEFDNYKRRTENDFANLAHFAAENTLTQLLPVLDDLARSLKSGKDKSGDDPFYKGIEMVQQKFLKILDAQGLKTMDAVGKAFNVDFHDALLQMPRTDVPPHIVVEEVEKGYLLFDKVIRHAKVIVSAAMPDATGEEKKG